MRVRSCVLGAILAAGGALSIERVVEVAGQSEGDWRVVMQLILEDGSRQNVVSADTVRGRLKCEESVAELVEVARRLERKAQFDCIKDRIQPTAGKPS